MFYDLKDEDQAKEYLDNLSIEYRFQCYQEKNPEGCHRLGDFLESIRREFEKAAKVFETNCNDYKYGHSCFKYGNYFISGKGVALSSMAVWLRELLPGSEQGKRKDILRALWKIIPDAWVERDMEKGLSYHLKGCGHGYMPSCHNAGLIYSASAGPSGDNKLKDLKKAVQFFSKACEQDLSNSCHRLAGFYLRGSPPDVRKDLHRAFQLTKKACELDHCHACVNLSIMYRRGDGVLKNQALADKYKQRALEIQQTMTQQEQTIRFSE